MIRTRSRRICGKYVEKVLGNTQDSHEKCHNEEVIDSIFFEKPFLCRVIFVFVVGLSGHNVFLNL